MGDLAQMVRQFIACPRKPEQLPLPTDDPKALVSQHRTGSQTAPLGAAHQPGEEPETHHRVLLIGIVETENTAMPVTLG